MIRPLNLIPLVPFTLIVLYFLYPRFCVTQSNPCETSGMCGAFGICNSQDSPKCSCLKGFNPRNNQEWDSGNWSSGCQRRVPLNCEDGNNRTTNDGKEDGFLKLLIKVSTGRSDRWFGPTDQCEGRCLRNCSCVAYGFDTDLGCIFWSGTLMDIQKFPSGSGSDLFIRMANSELAGQKKNSKKMIIILIVLGSVVLSICIFFSWRWIASRGERNTIELSTATAVDTSVQDGLSHVNFQELPLFKFEIVANATNNFSNANKLGKGGFGTVYKGELANGREIAVKRLSQASRQGINEFTNEVMLISKLQHRNLVRLLGCCVEKNEKMLIYEYMPNKSMDFFLFDPSQDVLDWSKRFNIIEGICRGLLYLHRDSRLKIIHRDLKPGNILLDNDWNPKISDFGMARIFGSKQDHVNTLRVVGTYGYMAPEYAFGGRFSEKSDVFSLGVLILEITSGRRNTSFNYEDGPLNLLGYIWKLWKEENVVSSIDPKIWNPSNEGEVVRCINIGLLCVQEFPEDRPSVSAVLSMLSSEIVELAEPKQPAFTMKSRRCDAGTSSSQQSKSSSSVNNVTVTMVEGR